MERKVYSSVFPVCLESSFVFDWRHRVLHTKWVYQNVPSIHHDSDTIPWLCNYCWTSHYMLLTSHYMPPSTPFGLTSEYNPLLKSLEELQGCERGVLEYDWDCMQGICCSKVIGGIVECS